MTLVKLITTPKSNIYKLIFKYLEGANGNPDVELFKLSMLNR